MDSILHFAGKRIDGWPGWKYGRIERRGVGFSKTILVVVVSDQGDTIRWQADPDIDPDAFVVLTQVRMASELPILAE